MITLKNIESIYKKRIPYRFRNQIEKYINNQKVQGYIQKALSYNLDDKDSADIFKVGQHTGFYPHLYWLCFIYIHPLTKAGYYLNKIDKIHYKITGEHIKLF